VSDSPRYPGPRRGEPATSGSAPWRDTARPQQPDDGLRPEFRTGPTESDHATTLTRPVPVLPRPRESVPLKRAVARAQQKNRSWLIALATVVGVIAVAACGVGTWLLVREDGGTDPVAGSSAPPDVTESPEPPPPLIRDAAGGAVAIADLFDGDVIADGYQVLDAEALEDCAEAATAELADLLADGDCSQVVRATVAAPDGEHAATLGVVNLGDAEAAEEVRRQIEAGDGGAFTALRADGVSKDLGLSPTVLGFNTYGHFLLYTVIGRADGEAPSSEDDAMADMVADLVDGHLVDSLADWLATGPSESLDLG